MIYKIRIIETLEKVVEIEADSLDDAIDIAEINWKNEEYVLGAEEYTGVEFTSCDDRDDCE